MKTSTVVIGSVVGLGVLGGAALFAMQPPVSTVQQMDDAFSALSMNPYATPRSRQLALMGYDLFKKYIASNPDPSKAERRKLLQAFALWYLAAKDAA